MEAEKEEIEENICCLCRHEFRFHVDEGNGWRCHCLGYDGFQCECWLRKDHGDGDIKFYDLKSRIEEHIKELESIT